MRASRVRSITVMALVGVATTSLEAQEAPLRPLSDHLARSAEDPAGGMRYAARRCSALFSLISAQRRNRGDLATSEMYANWVIGFGAVAVRASVELGSTSQDAVHENEEAVDQIAQILKERMDRHMRFSGSYFAGDRLLSSDLQTCRDLVDELGL